MKLNAKELIGILKQLPKDTKINIYTPFKLNSNQTNDFLGWDYIEYEKKFVLWVLDQNEN